MADTDTVEDGDLLMELRFYFTTDIKDRLFQRHDVLPSQPLSTVLKTTKSNTRQAEMRQ